jgi:hypothetical protein
MMRFIGQDSAGFNAGDANLYRYAFNIPTTFVDPSGQAAFLESVTTRVNQFLQRNLLYRFLRYKAATSIIWSKSLAFLGCSQVLGTPGVAATAIISPTARDFATTGGLIGFACFVWAFLVL